MVKSTRKYVKKVKQPKENIEIIHKIQYNVTEDWISLVTASDMADKPQIDELLSIIKLNVVVLSKITGFKITDILSNVLKDINDNVKDRKKALVDTWPENQVKDIFKVKEDPFKRWK